MVIVFLARGDSRVMRPWRRCYCLAWRECNWPDHHHQQHAHRSWLIAIIRLFGLYRLHCHAATTWLARRSCRSGEVVGHVFNLLLKSFPKRAYMMSPHRHPPRPQMFLSLSFRILVRNRRIAVIAFPQSISLETSAKIIDKRKIWFGCPTSSFSWKLSKSSASVHNPIDLLRTPSWKSKVFYKLKLRYLYLFTW